MDDFQEQIEALINYYKRYGYVKEEKAFEAFRSVPRELFLPEKYYNQAYVDHPLPLMKTGQTISAPHMCVMILEYLKLESGLTVLEVGSGSGYQAALIANIVAKGEKPGHVYTIEINSELVNFAQKNLEKSGYSSAVTVIEGDGTLGYLDNAPYDRIVITAAGPIIPPPLKRQLKVGGYLVMPQGRPYSTQTMIRIHKRTEGSFDKEILTSVGFVPLRGKYGI